MKHRTGYLFRRGKNFYCFWRVNGKAFSKALRDENGNPITAKREAEEARAKLMAHFSVSEEVEALEAIAGKLEGRRAELAKLDEDRNPALRLADAWSRFLQNPNRPDSGEETLYQYECQWNAFTTWMGEKHAESFALRDVTKGIAEEYAGHLNHGRFSPNTQNKHLNLLTLVFRVLKKPARITENPWEDIQRKRLVTHSRRELTVEELKTVCQSATGELQVLLALGVYSGMRLGDCATLRWCETDLVQGIIRRIPNKTARRNPKPVLVPIHPALCDMLAEIAAQDRGDYVLPKTAALYLHRTDAVTDQVQAHFAACGIKCHKPGTGAALAKADSKNGQQQQKRRAVIEVGFHSLRHSFVSICRASNVPLAVVESIVGHSTPAMTRHYTHTGEEQSRLAVASLPRLLGDGKGDPQQKPSPEAILAKAAGLIEGLNGKNWKGKRKELLALLKGPETTTMNLARA